MVGRKNRETEVNRHRNQTNNYSELVWSHSYIQTGKWRVCQADKIKPCSTVSKYLWEAESMAMNVFNEKPVAVLELKR